MLVNKSQINKIYTQVVNNLDISEELFQRAEKKYMDIASWFEENIQKYDFVIYQQGSFALGTVTKPISDADEYDLDLVCEINNASDLTAEQLKKRSYDWLNRYGKYERLKEKTRCWQVIYSDSLQFHIDFLPSLPLPLGDERILITDKDDNYKTYEYIGSNPKGYAAWFKERMAAQYALQEHKIAIEKYAADIKKVPRYAVKTPLQKAIQLLKRHRDILFKDDTYNVTPISIIITTLSAHTYNNEDNIYDALLSIIKGMPRYINKLADGSYSIENPSCPTENFAEKWNEHPERAVAFFEWIEQVKLDLVENLISVDTTIHAGNLLKQSLGENIVQKSFAALDTDVAKTMLEESNEKIFALVPVRVQQLLSVPHRQKVPWSLPRGNRVIIKTLVIDKNGNSYDYKSDGSPIEKNASIEFKALFGGLKQPYIVRWQIVNTGYEASLAKQLRGDLEVSNKGKYTRQEGTQYSGSHFVQCFVTKNNQCLAKSDIFIVNIA